jgi:hypothetical protein
MKSGNLKFLEPSGSLQACNGSALPYIVFCLKVSLTGWYFGSLPYLPPKQTDDAFCEIISRSAQFGWWSSFAHHRVNPVPRLLHTAHLTQFVHHWEVLISNSVRPAPLNKMQFYIPASDELHGILRAAVRPTGLHIWTMVWSNRARLVKYTMSSKLNLRPPKEVNREWCNCQ